MSTGGTNRADRRVLDEAGGFRAMTGVMAIMLFLTVLAAALAVNLPVRAGRALLRGSASDAGAVIRAGRLLIAALPRLAGRR